jgi:hypothetical protein
MPKITILADSHQLSEYQRCPRLFQYSTLERKGTRRLKDALNKGTGMHNLLYLYYKSRIKNLSVEKSVKNALRYMRYQRSMTKDHTRVIYPKVLQYFAHYANETWKPLQAEIGFSKPIYEDDEHLFVYQGKIDLLMEVQRVNAFVDHKTQSMQKQLPQDSNQFLGYAWATGWNMGIINYINLSESKAPKDAFRREICNYTPQLVQEWKDTAIETFLRMAADMRREKFNKQRQGCLGVYGLCDFIDVCKQTSPVVIKGILERDFITKEHWSPWD